MINQSRRTVGIATLGLLAAVALVVVSGIGRAVPADKASGGSNLKAEVVGDGAEANRGAVLDSSQVCFINDRYMGKPQIPVKVQGKVLYFESEQTYEHYLAASRR